MIRNYKTGIKRRYKKKKKVITFETDQFTDNFAESACINMNNAPNVLLKTGFGRGCETDKSMSPISFKSTCGTCSVHEISRFERVLLSSSNCIVNDQKTLVESSLRATTKPNQCCDSNSADDNGLSPISAVCPNILKHNRKERSNDFLSGSPVKTLTFSPSRFLNTRSDTKQLKNDSVLSKDLSISSCSFDTEDSGIGGSDIDITVPSSPHSRASISCQQLSQRCSKGHTSLLSSPEADHSYRSTYPMQSTPKGSEAVDFIQTPVITKFLNESAPRTPTPFKCPRHTAINKGNAGSDKLEHTIVCPLAPHDEFCFKRPSPITSRRRWRDSFKKSLSGKTARKALILDHDHNLKRSLFENHSNFDISDRSICLKSFDQSNLIENTALVEKRRIHFCGKSKYFTRKASALEQSQRLDKQWVSIACGRSVDQKAMTEAAKRCLQRHLSRKSVL